MHIYIQHYLYHVGDCEGSNVYHLSPLRSQAPGHLPEIKKICGRNKIMKMTLWKLFQKHDTGSTIPDYWGRGTYCTWNIWNADFFSFSWVHPSSILGCMSACHSNRGIWQHQSTYWCLVVMLPERSSEWLSARNRKAAVQMRIPKGDPQSTGAASFGGSQNFGGGLERCLS